MKPDELRELQAYLTQEELDELNQLIAEDKACNIWAPISVPQQMALDSVANVVGYGGAAGGGKTDLACGKALTRHKRVAIFRREATQLTGIIDRLADILGHRIGYNGQEKIWRAAGPRSVQIELGSAPNPGDETKHQGRPKDLLVIDEAANFLESQVRFLMGWVRTTIPGQLCQTLLTFNPPTDAEGRWVISFFAPWLDRKFPRPARPGELRYVAVINGKDVWLDDDDKRPFVLVEGQRVYDFDPARFAPTEVITPQSRTFIPAKVTDNACLTGTGYMTQLQALPEPLRSQMLNGDFAAGMEDDAFQVCPTAWVEAAMARWTDLSPKPEMLAVGVDVARGGRDNTIIARKHAGLWFDKPLVYPGPQTPSGSIAAGLVVAATRDGAPQNVDVIGIGASCYDFLIDSNQDAYGINVSEDSPATDHSGMLQMFNLRSALWWAMREALDPDLNTGIALPNDPRLLADLCAPRWKLQNGAIRVEARDEIEKRIGRSPDWGSAYILALIDTPKRRDLQALASRQAPRGEYNPIEHASGVQQRGYGDYDPLAGVR